MGVNSASKDTGQRAAAKKIRRGEDTRIAVIEMAESLIGELGVDAVSLRQIGSAIGSLNTNVVTYYFGGKETLIEAIFNYRLPQLETRRAELLAAADHRGTGHDMATLLDCLWRPALEQCDARGRRSYMAFLGSVSRSRMHWIRSASLDASPTVKVIADRLFEATPEPARHLFDQRLQISSAMIVSCLAFIDQRTADGGPQNEEHFFRDAIGMSAAAMSAGIADED